nr:zinc finger BED domain-containing protein RICESLEEPER 2-like [Tanacetum cinerariifolium]
MYEVREPLYKHCPSDDDWEKLESICKTLEAFDACTNIISGSDYPTSNLYFGEVQYIKQVLDRQFNDEREWLRKMVTKMKEKFDKYWNESNMLMCIGSILDPRSKRAEEKRNKPPTQAQQRKIMCTYLKNIEGKKLIDLKNKYFDSIKKMFDRAFKRINTFVDYITELVEESSKKAKAKVTEDEEGVAVDVMPLAVKPPSIIDWKIQKEGKKRYYKIIRADGSSKIYLIFGHMLKDFDIEDVETLWKLVKLNMGQQGQRGTVKECYWVI